MKRLLLIVGLTLLWAAAHPALAQSDGRMVRRIMDRGELIGGVNTVLPGFGAQSDAGDFIGFDTDICRAVAAAVLGDANAIAFRSLTGAERPTALTGGEVDLISRNTTWTLSRDTEWGATFGPTTFYDGQGIMQFMVDVIAQMGNYAEIFDRNLGPDTIFGRERGFNALWKDGGLMVAAAFR